MSKTVPKLGFQRYIHAMNMDCINSNSMKEDLFGHYKHIFEDIDKKTNYDILEDITLEIDYTKPSYAENKARILNIYNESYQKNIEKQKMNQKATGTETKNQNENLVEDEYTQKQKDQLRLPSYTKTILILDSVICSFEIYIKDLESEDQTYSLEKFDLTYRHLFFTKKDKKRGINLITCLFKYFDQSHPTPPNDLPSPFMIRFYNSSKSRMDVFVKSKNDFEQIKKWLRKLCVQQEFEDEYLYASDFEDMETNYYEGKGVTAKVRKIIKKRTEVGENKYYAAKVYKKKVFLKSANLNRGIINELQTMRVQDHPNICKHYETFESKSHIILVQELMDEIFYQAINCNGQYGKEMSDTEGLTYEQKLQLSKQLLSAGEHLKAKGVIHRDISPDNILCKTEKNENLKNYQWKLIDFGAAEFYTTEIYDDYFRGTIFYICPRLLASAKDLIPRINYGPEVDAYSIGAILYNVFAEKSLFTIDQKPEQSKFEDTIRYNIHNKINFEVLTKEIISENGRKCLEGLLETEPNTRITVEKCLQSEFLDSIKN